MQAGSSQFSNYNQHTTCIVLLLFPTYHRAVTEQWSKHRSGTDLSGNLKTGLRWEVVLGLDK